VRKRDFARAVLFEEKYIVDSKDCFGRLMGVFEVLYERRSVFKIM
jgi:hypothetical protein